MAVNVEQRVNQAVCSLNSALLLSLCVLSIDLFLQCEELINKEPPIRAVFHTVLLGWRVAALTCHSSAEQQHRN